MRKQRQGGFQEHETDKRLGKSVYNAEKSLSDATPYGAYETVEQALAGNRNASRFVMDLNGDWKFKMYPSPEAVEAFYEENFDHAAWDTIPVPVQLGIAGIWKAGLHQYAVSVQTGGKRRSI